MLAASTPSSSVTMIRSFLSGGVDGVAVPVVVADPATVEVEPPPDDVDAVVAVVEVPVLLQPASAAAATIAPATRCRRAERPAARG